MNRTVARIGTPVLLTAGLLVATVAFAEGLTPTGSPEWLVPVLIVQAVGVLVNLGVISWAKWSIEKIADGSSRRAVETHNDRGDAHLIVAANLREAFSRVDRDVEGLRHDVAEVRRAAAAPRNPLDSPNPRRADDPPDADFRPRHRGRS